MVKLVSWNIAKRVEPWRELMEMAIRAEVDVALLQEAGSPPGDLVDMIQIEDDVFWSRNLYDRWPLVVGLSDRVKVENFSQVPPVSDLAEGAIGVSGIGTIAAAKVTPLSPPGETFIAVSMYARWMKPHPSTRSSWKSGASDVSAHRILSDLSAFIGHEDPKKHRILAAGDLNMFHGATGNSLSLPERERHGVEPLRRTRPEVSRTAGTERSPGQHDATRCAAGHAKCPDPLQHSPRRVRCRSHPPA